MPARRDRPTLGTTSAGKLRHDWRCRSLDLVRRADVPQIGGPRRALVIFRIAAEVIGAARYGQSLVEEFAALGDGTRLLAAAAVFSFP